jgi:hypothetical protein
MPLTLKPLSINTSVTTALLAIRTLQKMQWVFDTPSSNRIQLAKIDATLKL